MINKIEIEAKNLLEAQKKAEEELKIPLEKLSFKILKEKKGILGIGASSLFEVSWEEETLINQGKKYLESILENLNVDFKIEVLENDNEFSYNIQSDNEGLLIGRNGKTLESFTTLLRIFITGKSEEKIIVKLNIGDYHERRKNQLEIIATKTAKEVIRSGVPVKIDRLNSYERKIIHEKLSTWKNITTESVGENENRIIIIKPRKR